MEAASAQHENDKDTDCRSNPGSPRKSREQAEEEHHDEVCGQDPGGHRSPTDELGKSHGQQHREEDAQKVRVGQGDVGPDDVISGSEVAATKNSEGRLENSDGGD